MAKQGTVDNSWMKRPQRPTAADKKGWAEVDKQYRKDQRSKMKEDFSPIADAITLVANDQHSEATPIINDLLGARVMDSLQDRKETIAQSLFAPSADALQEEVVQEEHESVEDFVKRGGVVKQVAPGKAHGSQKPQTIKKAKQYFVKKG